MKEGGGKKKVISERRDSLYIMRVRACSKGCSKKRNGIAYNRKTSVVYSSFCNVFLLEFMLTGRIFIARILENSF